MANTKFVINLNIQTQASIKQISHNALQGKKKPGQSGVLFGLHIPDWKLVNAGIEWNMNRRKGKPTGVSSIELDVRYTGQILISKAIPSGSPCYKFTKTHEQEHQKICVVGTRASARACEKILKKHYKAVLKSDYRNDIEEMHANEKKALTKIAKAAYTEMDDGPYYKVAEASLAIDTPSHYKIIDMQCAAFG